MNDNEALIDRCASEPIATPGLVQSHGFLFVVSAKTLEIEQVSTNILQLIGCPPDEVIGKPLPDLLEESSRHYAGEVIRRAVYTYINPFSVTVMDSAGRTVTCNAIAHSIDDESTILELEPVALDKQRERGLDGYFQMVETSLASTSELDSVVEIAATMADQVKEFAGFDRVMTATTLPSYTTFSGADRAGTLSGNPDVTYVTAKDTMTQTLAVTGFTANGVVKAGEVIQVTGRNRLNLSTRQPMLTAAGAQVLWTAVVTADVPLDGSGAGNLVCTGPAIFESAGQYNTVDSALTSGDVVTLLYPASSVIQPNLFYHRDAYGIGSVPIEKLYSTDTLATTEDGLQLRCSKGASIRENKQIVRFDLRPAYSALNPFFAGQAFGS